MYEEPGSGGHGRKRRSTEEKTFIELDEKMTKVAKTVGQIKEPEGKKDNPIRHCKDMLKCSKKYVDGMHYSRLYMALL